ncbi:MAG: DUF4097 family beta strand repeat protein [Lachnospiraceae bacterium]|nr:DUF4097 family beta strand repeat protein [Lachnospiraceae bacterium]
MTKQEYIEKLARALERKAPDMKDEVLEDYETHFTMAMAEGKSEEEICDELGDIDEFVSEFASTEGKKKESKHYSYHYDGGNLSGMFSELGKGIGDMVDGILSSVMPYVKEHNNEQNYDEYEEDDADTASSSESNESSLMSIVVDADVADVIVQESDDDEVHVRYENRGSLKQQLRYRYFFREENNTIYTGVRRAYTKSGYVSINHTPHITLTIEVPDAMDNIEIHSMSGDIEVEEVNAEKISISSTSGDISFEGNAKKLTLNTVSGDIECTTDERFEGDMHTVSGDINLEANSAFNAKMATTSGDIEIELNDTDGYDLKFNTVSGDVDIDYVGECHSFSRSGRIGYGNNGAVIVANTVSGDIKVTD